MSKDRMPATFVPPHSIEAEMAVLGAMMLGDKGAADEGLGLLTAADFYRDVHADVFEAMAALRARSEPIDAVTLKEELARRGCLERSGGIGYLMQLGDIEFTTAHLAHYAAIVRDKAIKRGLLHVAREISGMALKDEEDGDCLRDKAEQLVLGVGASRTTDNWHPLRALMDVEAKEIEERGFQEGAMTGCDTGFSEFNLYTGGLQETDLIIVAGRPGMGKTGASVQVGTNAAKHEQRRVGVFSLEMSKEQLVQRIIGTESRVSTQKLRNGNLADDEWKRVTDGIGRLWDAPVWIDDSGDLSASDVRTRARRLKARHGLDLVIVDYVQIMAGSGRSDNRNEDLTETIRSLKGLAKELRIPVIALSQLSRAVEKREDKRPMLSDLRESGSLEAEADIVVFLYRPEYYRRKQQRAEGTVPDATPECEETELIIAKQRNGPVGTIRLNFEPHYVRFSDPLPAALESPF